MGKVKTFLRNPWFRFGFWTVIYVLWFVIWTRNAWWLIGVPFIFDACVTKYFKRYVWSHYTSWRNKHLLVREIMGWVEALIFAAVVAGLIHIYLFQMYKIPTSSMEKSMMVGDYLYVSKVTFGPQMPNTPISMPLVHNTMPFSKTGAKSYSECIRNPYKRLTGRRSVQRDDIVVFNFPAGDTVLLENQAITYYDVLRSYQMTYGNKLGRERLFKDYTVVSRPVDKRENYVKRAVGIPGDTIEVRGTTLYVNGAKHGDADGRMYLYNVFTTSPIHNDIMDRLGIGGDDILSYNRTAGTYQIFLQDKEVDILSKLKNVETIERYEDTLSSLVFFPNDRAYSWTEDNFGPLWVPKKGATVRLNMHNLPLYSRIIDVYENNDLAVRDSVIYINGKPTDKYTFKMNYYFMMGDNRHNSADSRFWGFVPEDHIVGHPSFIWLSIDKDKSFPHNIRWERMFKKFQ